MNSYPSYKPSGIDWLPKIPSHWEMSKAKYYFKYTTGFTPPTGQDELYNEGITWVTIADMNQKIVSESVNTLAKLALEKYKPDLTIKGSLLFSFKLSVGKVAFAGKDLYTNEAIISILPDEKYDVRYFYYTLPEQLLQNANENIYGAKMLNQELIRNASICFPPLKEQTFIASYLDEKTAQIDILITNKQKLIELLKEERTAVINNAVSKGIDSRTEFKPSGNEWLGNIPIHWKVKKLRFLCKITTGAKNTEDRIEDGEYPFFVRSQTIERINSYSFDGEGILTAGDGVGVAKVFHYINGKFDFHQRVYLFFDFAKEISAKFLFHFIQMNLIYEVLRYNAKSTVDSLRLPMLKDFPITFPPSIKEQTSIVNHIQSEIRRIDDLISKIEKEIELMQEYRTALISEVVTGKIKVTEN